MTRRSVLARLVEENHQSHGFGDYDDTYAEFAATYLVKGAKIPRYASIMGDETYNIVNVFDTLPEALADQVGEGDTLNVGCGVVDLDTGKHVEHRTVVLTAEAYAIVCGMVQESSAVEADAIWSKTAEVWDEIRTSLPLADFKAAVTAGTIDYDPEP